MSKLKREFYAWIFVPKNKKLMLKPYGTAYIAATKKELLSCGKPTDKYEPTKVKVIEILTNYQLKK